MASLADLIALANAADGSGPAAVDPAALRLVLNLLAACAAGLLIAAAAAVAALSALARRRGSERRNGATGADSAAESAEKLRRNLQELVRKTNDRNSYINSIFSSIEDGFVLVDAENRVVLYNPRAGDLLGLGPSVFFEGRADESAAAEPIASVLRACASVSATKRPELLRLETSDRRLLEVRVSPVADKYRRASNLGSIAVAADVTELRKAESLKKDFVATVSHEFRTPLTLISGFVEMFKMRESIKSADRKRAFEIIDIETERLKRLVSELLTLSEIENELPRAADGPIDVVRVLADLAATLNEFAAKKRQSLETDLRVSPSVLTGNENWFYLAVKNILENAIKYTPEGGSIRMEAFEDADSVVVSVSDTGIGIAPDELDKIFERFYRVEKARGSGSGGSGLGLALVKDIATIFGGRVRVESEIGKGSTFTLILPRAAADGGMDEGR